MENYSNYATKNKSQINIDLPFFSWADLRCRDVVHSRRLVEALAGKDGAEAPPFQFRGEDLPVVLGLIVEEEGLQFRGPIEMECGQRGEHLQMAMARE